ncbi:sigma-70 family RNA polymerase sigma factor [Nocardioides rubriscoriae]|uniref:sigma-70 family RNA polymerase sigma factor n=1 Tax=Nocardioides rubriscoriae TaxID=642762 RepID=UPI0011DF095D|nr:FliA/WhiG family RNA polymerase sigma factor [Nocardioides rubriscoriae]
MTERAIEIVGAPTADELITSHLGLVAHVVRETVRNVPAHVSRDDLHSAGLTALVKAARAFDAERGVSFARYAITRIRGAMVDELRGIDWASRSVRRRSRDIDAARSELAVALGRVPTTAEIASSLGISAAEVEGTEGDVARAQVLSLQAGGETPYEEVLVSASPTPEEQLVRSERLSYLVDAIAELPERMRVVVQEYFIAERPMAEIAATLGVSESRVSQIRAEALVLLRDAMNTALDPDLVVAPARADGCVARRRQTYFQAVADRHAAAMRPRRMTDGLSAVRFNSVS